MSKPKRQKFKIKYIVSELADKERQAQIDKAYDVLFKEVFKTLKK